VQCHELIFGQRALGIGNLILRELYPALRQSRSVGTQKAIDSKVDRVIKNHLFA
jgi:hypothetical protein